MSKKYKGKINLRCQEARDLEDQSCPATTVGRGETEQGSGEGESRVRRGRWERGR